MNVLRPESVVVLCALFERGATYREAAREAGCHKRTVANYFSQWRAEKLARDAAPAATGQAPDYLFLKASDILAVGPRYLDGMLWDQRTHWSAEDQAALVPLSARAVPLEKVEPILARPASAIAWKAAELELDLPRSWKLKIRKPRERSAPRIQLDYPFIVEETHDDHALLLAVSNVVPRGLPGDLRADICQDLVLAVLEGEISTDDLARQMPRYLKAARKRYQMPWGTVNLDAPLWSDGRPLSETIGENRLYQ